MYMVISFNSDIISQEANCQFEVSKTLTHLINKYGTPPTELKTDGLDDVDSFDMFRLDYFQIVPGIEFSLMDTCLSCHQIETILAKETEATKTARVAKETVTETETELTLENKEDEDTSKEEINEEVDEEVEDNDDESKTKDEKYIKKDEKYTKNMAELKILNAEINDLVDKLPPEYADSKLNRKYNLEEDLLKVAKNPRKTYSTLLKTYHKVKKSLQHHIKFRSTQANQNCAYLLIYFDKGIIEKFPKRQPNSDDGLYIVNEMANFNGLPNLEDTEEDTIKNNWHDSSVLYMTSDIDPVVYNYAPHQDWTTIDYELYYHQGTHFIITETPEEIFNWIDQNVKPHPDQFDLINLFRAKVQYDKEFIFNLDETTEVWIDSKSFMTPYRLTYNRFYNEPMELIKSQKIDKGIIEIYRSSGLTTVANHILVAELLITTDKIIPGIEYYNRNNSKTCLFEDISKSHYRTKCALKHYRNPDSLIYE